MRIERYMVYVYNDKLLGAGLILCPFRRIIVMDSPIWPMIYIASGSYLNNGASVGFYLMERD